MLRLLYLLWSLLLLDTEPDDGDQEPDWSEIRDPIAKLHSEWEKNKRLTRRLHVAEAKIEELGAAGPPKPDGGTPPAQPTNGPPATGSPDDLRASRLEAAFLRAAYTREDPLVDMETAWDLFHMKGFADPVSITDSGEAEGMDEALDKLVSRYPYLADVPDTADPFPTTHSKQPALNKKRPIVTGISSAASLTQRLPALRRGGR
jgi:hypothetical protein